MIESEKQKMAMSQKDLGKRVATLERLVRKLLALHKGAPGPMDWLSSFGMFTGNKAMKTMDAECQRLRDRERRQAGARLHRRRRVK